MSIVYVCAFLACCLITTSVVNAKSAGENAFLNEEIENRVDVQYPDVQDNTDLQRPTFDRGCQMGTVPGICWPDECFTKNYHVNYTHIFVKKPSVSVSLAGLDVAENFNLRVVSTAVDVTTSGFNIRFKTWADTKIYSVVFSWIACV